ncbi:Pr6Pr family membrane protein [Lysobacter solisilvae (ex Woo and Kim 2020)]|uniref:Pr6Pr family membrane protein n=1 Tax=Agrilutibacter terrestris TaxID=2865112 RepID=A0A7H0FVE3_9GAMM|nr:Pr6Pr family membrane protein [Lysobacter terrestris]QNP40009.1 Pr6Pr family membrane protein [Lysobacter terrestris]
MTANASRRFALLIAAVAAAALVLQYVLLIQLTRDSIGPVLATVRFFSYFTILSNLLVLLVTAHAAVAREGAFAAPRMRGGVAMCVGVTMGIYFLVLSHLWQPQGAQQWADTALHYAVPSLYLLWWVLCVPHGTLRWRDLPRWLLFPLAYLGWVLARGAWVREYPYPFLDLTALDGATVARNIVGVFAVFVVVGGVLLLADRWLPSRRRALAT